MLIVGCGDVGLRVAAVLRERVGLMALTSSSSRVDELRSRGIIPLIGNLDVPTSLRRLAGLATRVIHLAPPPGEGEGDPRTRALVAALRLRRAPASLVYGSTSGVYGDCGGALVDETAALKASTPRAQRRVDAETLVRHIVLARVREYFRTQNIPGDHHAR